MVNPIGIALGGANPGLFPLAAVDNFGKGGGGQDPQGPVRWWMYLLVAAPLLVAIVVMLIKAIV